MASPSPATPAPESLEQRVWAAASLDQLWALLAPPPAAAPATATDKAVPDVAVSADGTGAGTGTSAAALNCMELRELLAGCGAMVALLQRSNKTSGLDASASAELGPSAAAAAAAAGGGGGTGSSRLPWRVAAHSLAVHQHASALDLRAQRQVELVGQQHQQTKQQSQPGRGTAGLAAAEAEEEERRHARDRQAREEEALGRRMVGRLSRRILASVAASAATRSAAHKGPGPTKSLALGSWGSPEAAAVRLSRDESEAVLGAVWAFSHLADQHDTLQLVGPLGAGEDQNSGPEMRVTAAAAQAAAAAALAAGVHPTSAVYDTAAAQAAAAATSVARQMPFREVMCELWQLLLVQAASPPPAAGPAAPHTWSSAGGAFDGNSLPRQWLLWAVWSAQRAAPDALPPLLAAIVSEQSSQGAGRGSRAGPLHSAGADPFPALSRLPAWQLTSVLWACGRYADWSAARAAEEPAERADDEEGQMVEEAGDSSKPHPRVWAARCELMLRIAVEATRLLAVNLEQPATDAGAAAQQQQQQQQQPQSRLAALDALTALRAGLAVARATANAPWPEPAGQGSSSQMQPATCCSREQHRRLLAALLDGVAGLAAHPRANLNDVTAALHLIAELRLLISLPASHVVAAASAVGDNSCTAAALAAGPCARAASASASASDGKGAGSGPERNGDSDVASDEAGKLEAAWQQAMRAAEMAVLRLVAGMEPDAAAALLSLPGLRSQGVAPARGWYRRVLRLPLKRKPARVRAQATTAGVRLQQHPMPFRLRLLYGLQRSEAEDGAVLLAPSRADAGTAAAVANGTGFQPPALALSMSAATNSRDGKASGSSLTESGTGHSTSSVWRPHSLELQLAEQRRLLGSSSSPDHNTGNGGSRSTCGVRQHGTTSLLALLNALGAVTAASKRAVAAATSNSNQDHSSISITSSQQPSPEAMLPRHLAPRPATVRAALNALALRWLRRGVPSTEVAQLVSLLYALRWRPRSAVSVLVTAWRPFVLLAPQEVSDAAMAGMAQALGVLTSHERAVRSRAASRAAKGRGGGGSSNGSGGGWTANMPWPKLRAFWAAVLRLALVRMEHAAAAGRPPVATWLRGPSPAGTAAAARGSWHNGVVAGAGAGKQGNVAIAAAAGDVVPPLTAACLVRLVWSSARQGARRRAFMAAACAALAPLLLRTAAGAHANGMRHAGGSSGSGGGGGWQLAAREVGWVAWGVGHPRYNDPRVSEALLALLRSWLAAGRAAGQLQQHHQQAVAGGGGGGGGGSGAPINWTAATRVAWALLRLDRLPSASSPELWELLLGQLLPALQRAEAAAARHRQQAWQRRQSAAQKGANVNAAGRAGEEDTAREAGGRRLSPAPLVNPRALVALLWAVHERQLAEQQQRQEEPPLLSRPDRPPRPSPTPAPLLAYEFLARGGADAFLAGRISDLPPAALLQLLQIIADGAIIRNGGSPIAATRRCGRFLAAFGRLVEQRPRWLLRRPGQAAAVLACYQVLGLAAGSQVEELTARLRQLEARDAE